MPVTPSERRQFIAELRAQDPVKWAPLIKMHQELINKENKK